MALGGYEDAIDTILIPPGTQYGATLCKPGKRKPSTRCWKSLGFTLRPNRRVGEMHRNLQTLYAPRSLFVAANSNKNHSIE
jgi:hypothetical protein